MHSIRFFVAKAYLVKMYKNWKRKLVIQFLEKDGAYLVYFTYRVETVFDKEVSDNLLERDYMNQKYDEQRIRILDGVIKAFNQKGLKFTMDDLASILSMSKKTIYKLYDDKEELFLAMVDYLFDSIKESEEKILNDESLSLEEKIRKILGVMPDGYGEIDFRQLYSLREKYPVIYGKVEERLETGWETTLALLEEGQKQGIVREGSLPILKMMMESSLEQFFQRDILVRNNLTYTEALNQVVDILLLGVMVP